MLGDPRAWPEGRWLRAERQDAGRGRLGRDWAGAAGNLHASTLVHLHGGDPQPAGLGLVVAVALHDAVRRHLAQSEIALKWPNDLMHKRAKLAGILLERVADSIVVGVGVNVVTAPQIAGRETAALVDLPGGAAITATALAESLVERLAHWLAIWRRSGLEDVRPAWLAAAHPIGTDLRITNGSGAAISGTFMGIAADGALLLNGADGARHVIHSGDVGFV